MAATCEHVSAKPAMQVQCPHSTVQFDRMATPGRSGNLLLQYECLTLPTRREISFKHFHSVSCNQPSIKYLYAVKLL